MAAPEFQDPVTHELVHGPAIADVEAVTGDAAANASAINAILAALRSANVIATNSDE